MVTRTPSKHFFKCHLKFLQAKQISARETEAALPGQQNLLSAAESEVNWIISKRS